MMLEPRNLVSSEEQLHTLAEVDSAAKQLALETMRGVEIQKQLDRMSARARRWAIENTDEFCALVQYHVTENRKKDLSL